jgi:hypothetical protein
MAPLLLFLMPVHRETSPRVRFGGPSRRACYDPRIGGA